MTSTNRYAETWFRVAWQGIAVLFLGVVTGLSVNHLRLERLPLVGDWSNNAQVIQDSGENLIISLGDAGNLFFSHKAVFIDARSPEPYCEGHIPGAQNLPWEAFDEFPEDVMADIPEDSIIITYCDGEDCGSSRELSLALFDRGYVNVKMFVNGWSLWKKNQFPVKTGPDPGVP